MKDKVLVVGGGVIGICSAYYLSAQGMPVTVLEKGEIAAGCSYGNAGLIVPSYAIPLAAPGVLTRSLKWLLDTASPFYIEPRLNLDLLLWLCRFAWACRHGPMYKAIPVLLALGRASAALLEELIAAGRLVCGYQKKGWLLLFDSQEGLREAVNEAALLRRYGVASEALDRAGVCQILPNVTDKVVGGIFYREDAHLAPELFVQGVAVLAQRHGALLMTKTEVLGFKTANRRITTVITTRGDLQADTVVLAAGAWSPILARDLQIRLPIQAAKGYSLTVKAPSSSPPVPLYLTESKVAITPLGDRLRFSGTLELAGLDMTVDLRRVAAIRQATDHYLNGLSEVKPLEIWRGLRPVTPDGLPIIGRSRHYENLIVATGHGMLGMTLGPITGKLVAQLVMEQKPDLDLQPLLPERF